MTDEITCQTNVSDERVLDHLGFCIFFRATRILCIVLHFEVGLFNQELVQTEISVLAFILLAKCSTILCH